MSDDADRADALIEAARQAAIARARRVRGPAPTGRCLWCSDPLPQGQRWCGPECREDWEARHARATRR